MIKDRFSRAISEVKESPFRFVGSMLLDMLLIGVIIGMFYYGYTESLPHLEVMIDTISEHALQSEFNESYSALIRIGIMFLAGSFLVFVLLKSVIWNFLVLKKKDYLRYLLNFSIISLAWGLVLYFISSAYISYMVRTILLQPLIPMAMLHSIFIIANAILIYFAVIAFSKADDLKSAFRDTFIDGTVRAWQYAPGFVAVCIMLFIFYLISEAQPMLGLIYLILIVLPALALNRLMIKG